jgi:hypothetical protein
MIGEQSEKLREKWQNVKCKLARPLPCLDKLLLAISFRGGKISKFG